MAATIEPISIGVAWGEKPAGVNLILGQTHFIKTVEDLYEAVAGSVPGAQFGLAFSEASGDRLVRAEGPDEALRALATRIALLRRFGYKLAYGPGT